MSSAAPACMIQAHLLAAGRIGVQQRRPQQLVLYPSGSARWSGSTATCTAAAPSRAGVMIAHPTRPSS